MRRYTLAGAQRRIGRALYRVARRFGGVPSEHRLPAPHAADIAVWWRRSVKLRPRAAQVVSLQNSTGSPALAVVMHVHFPELVDELLERLSAIPVPFDLFVTDSSGSLTSVDVSSLPLARGVTLAPVVNRGRDILPLITLVNDGVLDSYELILKVHTKKSAWRDEREDLSGSGTEWRGSFLDSLLPDRAGVESILAAFADDPSLGILTASGSIVGPEHWGGDRAIVADLLHRIQMDVHQEDLKFPSGSMYWTRAFLLQGLRAFDLTAEDFEPEDGQIDATTAHGIERVLGYVTTASGYRMAESDEIVALEGTSSWQRWESTTGRRARARVVPFYLPQFHTFEQNDEWWGKGFTEWSNVTAARPLYLGHTQPLLPSELGFYDLSHPEVRSRQYELVRQHGIAGLMYYYYWFSGERLMNGPVDDHRAGNGDEPFCIMWANENWTRRWDGGNKGILMGQDYDRVPAAQFILDVMDLLLDPRYIRVDGKPLIAVYKIAQFPDPAATFAQWRRSADEAGLPGLHIVSVDVGADMDGLEGDPTDLGFDAYLEFAPHNRRWDAQSMAGLEMDEAFHGNFMSYERMVDRACSDLRSEPVPDGRYPGVMVTFDNTARRQWNPDMWYGSNPFYFRRWLSAAVDAVAHRDPEHRLVFVNAWNEWAESAVLEPTQRFGRSYLHAVRDVLYR